MRRTIDYFFQGARRNWNEMLYSAQGERLNWRKQLRLVFLHADWLLSQGWEKPAGLDSTRWATVAFSVEPGDPVASGDNTSIASPNHGR